MPEHPSGRDLVIVIGVALAALLACGNGPHPPVTKESAPAEVQPAEVQPKTKAKSEAKVPAKVAPPKAQAPARAAPPAARPAAPPPVVKPAGGGNVMCCDGTRSPTCACSRSSFRGCCSHHGGICGGCE